MSYDWKSFFRDVQWMSMEMGWSDQSLGASNLSISDSFNESDEWISFFSRVWVCGCQLWDRKRKRSIKETFHMKLTSLLWPLVLVSYVGSISSSCISFFPFNFLPCEKIYGAKYDNPVTSPMITGRHHHRHRLYHSYHQSRRSYQGLSLRLQPSLRGVEMPPFFRRCTGNSGGEEEWVLREIVLPGEKRCVVCDNDWP